MLFRRLYGTGPAHLVLLLAGLTLGAATLLVLGVGELWDPEVWWQSIAVWFVGALLAHDLVLFPLYAGADRLLARLPTPASGPSARNHVRLPLLACGLVTLMFLPGILRRGADSYLTATGMTQDPFLLRWVLLCAGICLLSAAVYAVRRVLSGRRRRG